MLLRAYQSFTQSFYNSKCKSSTDTGGIRVSTTKFYNRHGRLPTSSRGRPSRLPDLRVKVFLKGPMGLAESKEPGKEVSLGRRDRYVVKWRRNMEDTKQGKFI